MDGEPFAIAASPIHLTEVGKAANRTGFSIQSCRSILNFVKRDVPIGNSYLLIVDVLRELGIVSEQPDSYLRKIVGTKKHRAFVTDAELLDITIGWLERRDIYQIYQSLPKYKTSKATDEYKQRQFDKFVQMAEGVYGNFLPWIFRACGQLSRFGAIWAQQTAWNDIADSLEMRASPESFETSITEATEISSS